MVSVFTAWNGRLPGGGVAMADHDIPLADDVPAPLVGMVCLIYALVAVALLLGASDRNERQQDAGAAGERAACEPVAPGIRGIPNHSPWSGSREEPAYVAAEAAPGLPRSATPVPATRCEPSGAGSRPQ